MKKISIIIPCYNEGACIKENIENKVIPFLKQHDFNYELILVDDGSKDDTKKVIESIDGIVAISYLPNRGKGGAVNEGIKAASGDYIMFMDADLSTDLNALLVVRNKCSQYDFIIGSRHLKESVLPQKQPLIRQFIGYVCRCLVNLKFHFHYKDTQCGFKAMKNEIAKDIANKQIINGFAFDVEYLYYAKLNKIPVLEIPVVWINDTSSTVKITSSSIQFLKDMKKIKKNKKNYLLSETGIKDEQ